jgi:hypothetical protein
MIVQDNAPTAATVGGTGTVGKVFPLLSNSSVAATLTAFGSGRLEGQQFVVRASGKVFVHGTTPTVLLTLAKGTSLTLASDTAVAVMASAATLVTAATYPWAIEVKCQGDSTSGIVQVISSSISINGVAASVTNANLTGINLGVQAPLVNGLPPLTSNEPSINLVMAVTFGVSDALNLATMTQFSLEA